MSKYTLFIYDLNGVSVVSAIHELDLGQFLKDYPTAKPLA